MDFKSNQVGKIVNNTFQQ